MARKRYSVKMSGASELAKALAKAGPKAVDALKQALHEEALIAFRNSQRQVPRRTGVLAGSGVVEPPRIEGKNVVVTIGYGGAAKDYALRQHEDMGLRHAGGRKAKYLEDPVRDQVSNLEQNLIARIERIVQK